MANTPLIPHSGLGNSAYSGDANGIMKVNPYEKLLWGNFASLIEQSCALSRRQLLHRSQ